MAIDRRKKKSQPHERQQGSAATATATKTGVTTFPKITPPKDTTTYYGGGGSQAVKQYVPTAAKTTDVPSTPPKTPTISTPNAQTNTPYPTTMPSWLDTQRELAQHYAGVPSGGGTGGGGGGGSRGSGSRSQTPTVKPPTQFTPTYSGQPSGGPPPEEWPADAGTGTGITWWGSGGGPQFIYDWQTKYQDQLKQLKEDELLLAAKLNDQFMRQLDQQIAQYTQYYEQMGQGVDPATEAALARLKQDMEETNRSILEYMNSRGIAQSGITAGELIKETGDFNRARNEMLTQKLTNLQNQFLSSMQNFMGQAMQGMGQYTQNAMGTQQRYSQGMQGAMQNAMEKTFGAWQQEQQQRAAMEREMVPYTYGPTPYQQQQLNYQRQQQQQSQQQFSTQEREALLYEDIRRVVQEAESGGMDGPTHLNNWFNRNARDIIETFGYNKYQQLREQIMNQMYPQPQQPSWSSYFR